MQDALGQNAGGESLMQAKKSIVADTDDAVTEDSLTGNMSVELQLPSFPVDRSVYIRSKAYPELYLSVRRSTQGEPAKLEKCDKTKKLPGCMWKIEPSLTTKDHYYLRTSDTEQTLHNTHYALGQRATLYPCRAGNFPNCQWSLQKTTSGYYKIKISGKHFFMTAPDEKNPSVTTQLCNQEPPPPECLWQVEQAACYATAGTRVQEEGETVFTVSPMLNLISCEEKCATTVNCNSFTQCAPEGKQGGRCEGKDRVVPVGDLHGATKPDSHCKTYMEVLCP